MVCGVGDAAHHEVVLANADGVHEVVEEFVTDHAGDDASAGDIDGDDFGFLVDHLAFDDAEGGRGDHAGGDLLDAFGELVVDDSDDEVFVEAADEAVDVGLVGGDGAEFGELGGGEGVG